MNNGIEDKPAPAEVDALKEAIRKAHSFLIQLEGSQEWKPHAYGFGLSADMQARCVARQIFALVRRHHLRTEETYILMAARMAELLTETTKMLLDRQAVELPKSFVVDRRPSK